MSKSGKLREERARVPAEDRRKEPQRTAAKDQKRAEKTQKAEATRKRREQRKEHDRENGCCVQ
ncbi:hypothetical protein HO173_004629 [Letharia columbiana]|uniref:Uncharacterized protein n=1 Tax=Letharia columbiana TaxID=112416 RepID=A0A8H6FYQ7_9LECA|nr:uncharacterized protein HO173_004629 [Letharia columbiana]KAF6237161.1 hypothetical protein HO173_004629 [Letharia columbiana]